MSILNNISRVVLLTLLTGCILFSSISHASIEHFEFENAQQEEVFNDLTKLLRCPKCQNQNISDSNAELAKDLRKKTYDLVIEGKSEQEVVDYMVARFGNFVRYDPPVTPATIFLWLGPLLFIIFGLLVLFRQIKKQSINTKTLNENEQHKLQQLLDQQHSKDTGS